MRRTACYILFLLFCGRTGAQCDDARLPVVFIHGFLASGDTWAEQVQRFVDAGYCRDRLFVFDWNSVGGNPRKTDSLLRVFIEKVLEQTHARQVDLVGHSAGGALGRGYLQDSAQASRVAHYVHIGSRKWQKELSWFPNSNCLNIYSASDLIAGTGAGNVAGALNLDLETRDHYETATCYESWSAMNRFFRDQDRSTPAPPPEKKNQREYSLAGKAVFLGDNAPMRNATVRIWKLDKQNGRRQGRDPDAGYKVDGEGRWGPFRAQAPGPYELELLPADESQRSLSYFTGTNENDNHLIYLRGFPQGNMIALLLGALPQKDSESLIVIYSSTRAMIGGRDSVTVNGIPVSGTGLTPAAKTIISSFIFDDGDAKTGGAALKQFGMTPFIGGVDIYLPASATGTHTIFYNGKTRILPAAPSRERVMLAVFD